MSVCVIALVTLSNVRTATYSSVKTVALHYGQDRTYSAGKQELTTHTVTYTTNLSLTITKLDYIYNHYFPKYLIKVIAITVLYRLSSAIVRYAPPLFVSFRRRPKLISEWSRISDHQQGWFSTCWRHSPPGACTVEQHKKDNYGKLLTGSN